MRLIQDESSHDWGDDDSVGLSKEQWPSATLMQLQEEGRTRDTREVDLNGSQWQERRFHEVCHRDQRDDQQ